MRLKLYITILIVFKSIVVISQNDSAAYKVYSYPNGNKSSEGYLVDGKPEGYWKTFYENGKLKSEGYRKHFELDSVWKFYNENEQVTSEINYKNNKKNGLKITYLSDIIIKETFVNDVKHGPTQVFYSDGKIKNSVHFKNGKEEGFLFEYNKDSCIIEVFEFVRGVLVNKEKINKTDSEKRKDGTWKYYDQNGFLVKEENFKNGLRHGYFKEYAQDGNLIKIEKYIDDKLQNNAPEFKKLDIKFDYYANGKVKIEGSYKDSIPEGVRRYYSEKGDVTNAQIFKDGNIIGEGIIDRSGKKQGKWKEFYAPSEETKNKIVLKAEGIYKNDIKIGKWSFYSVNTKLEQIGEFNKNGQKTGEWKWYYDSGAIRITEFFDNGKHTSEYNEYDETGKIICKGNYFDGLEEGFWYCETGDCREEGKYIAGKKEGEWKAYYDNKQVSFSGQYFDDSPIGRHIYYWETGKIREEGYYEMGKKNGDWHLYDYDGLLFLTINYKNGVEIKYNGVKVQATLE